MNSIRQIKLEFQTLFKHYHFSLLFAVIGFATYIFWIYEYQANRDYSFFTKIIFLNMVGFLLFVIVAYKNYQKFYVFLAIVVIIANYLFLPNEECQVEWLWWSMALVLFALLIGLTLVDDTNNDILFVARMYQIINTLVNSLLIAIGVFAALHFGHLAINTLLVYDFCYSCYKYIFGISFLLVFPIVFLFALPKNNLISKSIQYSIFEKLSIYFLYPITILYFAIIYIYLFQIIIASQMPYGGVVWIVAGFSVVSLIAYMNLSALHKMSRITHRVYWITIIIANTLSIIALYMRIEQYGFTPNRYFAAIIAIWFIFLAMYFLMYSHAKLSMIFKSLLVVIIVAVFTPFGAVPVSSKSQSKLLEDTYGIYVKSAFESESKPNTNIPKLQKKMSDQIYVLAELTNHKMVDNNEVFQDCNLSESIYQIALCGCKELGFEFKTYYEDSYSSYVAPKDFTIYEARHRIDNKNIAGYDYLVQYSYKAYVKIGVDEILGFDMELKNNNLVFTYTDTNETFGQTNISDLPQLIVRDINQSNMLIYTNDDINMSLKFYISSMEIDNNTSDIRDIETDVYIKFHNPLINQRLKKIVNASK